MAHLFRPTYTRPIPPDATRCTLHGQPAVRWKGRGGKPKTAALCADDPTRCLVESGVWHIAYTDAAGHPRTAKASRDRTSSEVMLGDKVRQVERERAGLGSALDAADALELLGARAEEYQELLLAQGVTERHAADTYRLTSRVLDACQFFIFRDLDRDRIVTELGAWREAGMGVETSNHYTRAVKAFAAWLSDKLGAVDPLRRLSCLNADVDPRIHRRVISDAEFARLLAATRTNYRRQCPLDGPARAVLYTVAAYTGLRAGELSRLTPAAFELHGRTPRVTIEARDAKGRREDDLPLPADVATELRAWLVDHGSGLLFPGRWAERRGAAEMLRPDLRAAGIPYRTADGTFDFHALRGLFITRLVLSGQQLPTVQRLARHSDPKLTMKHYVRLGLVDLQGAVEGLPKLAVGDRDARSAG